MSLSHDAVPSRAFRRPWFFSGMSPPRLACRALTASLAVMSLLPSRLAALFLVVVPWSMAPAATDRALAYGLALYEDTRYAEARSALSACQGGDPVELAFHRGRLALWFDEGEVALRELERAAALAPAEARVQNALGDACGLRAQEAPLLARLGWARRCRAAYQRAVELAPAEIAYRWSLLGFQLVAPRIAGGGLAAAREQAEAIARIDPAEGRAAHALVDLARGDVAAAFARFDGPLAASPDDSFLLLQVGRCAALSGQHLERGRKALERCLELTPPAERLRRACLHHRLGEVFRHAGNEAAARAQFQRAVEVHPDFRPEKVRLRY